MTQVYVQLIATFGLVVVALIGNRKLNRIGADAKEARDQTANTHDTNLRDDLDELRNRQATLGDELKSQQATLGSDLGLVMETFKAVHDDVRGIRHDINGLREDNGEIRRKQRMDASRARRDLRDHIAECSALTPPKEGTPE